MRVVKVFVISAVIAATGLIAPAVAQSRICSSLRAELSSLGSAGSSARDERRILRELDRMQGEARRARCRGGFFFFRSRNPACNAILARIDRLERQLHSARRHERRADRRESQRDRIRRAMAREGCFAPRDRQPEEQRHAGNRTICVRVCDGYYFPLAFSAPRSRLDDHAQRCLSMYSEGQAELYHYTPGGDVADAVSPSGQRYGDQPFAFDYRKAYKPVCAAQLQEGLEALGARVLASLPKPEKPKSGGAPVVVPVPMTRPSSSVDPETLANRAGNFVPRPVSGAEAVADIRRVGRSHYFAAATPGPPPTVPGYQPPKLRDFRSPQRATILPELGPPDEKSG